MTASSIEQPPAPEVAYQHERVTVWAGDCIDVLRQLDDDSIDAVVCDPPYGLEFMGKAWDSFATSATGRGAQVAARRAPELTPRGQGHAPGTSGPFLAAGVDSIRVAGAPFQQWCELWAAECLRVLRPGGHLLAFGGTRTYHRLTCGIEDAGFTIRDGLVWAYGSGFPKSLDVGRAVDKLVGAEGSWRQEDHPGRGGVRLHPGGIINQGKHSTEDNPEGLRHIYVASSDEGQQWSGWGTALKPSWEPIVLARKPFTGTVAENVMAHGTGALNIDACRIPHASEADRAESEGKNRHAQFGTEAGQNNVYGDYSTTPVRDYDGSKGRWPSNVLLTHGADCTRTGTRTVTSDSHHPARRGQGGLSTTGHAGQDGLDERAPGTEVVEAWTCAPGCPVAELDRQSGASTSTGGAGGRSGKLGYHGGGNGNVGTSAGGYGDTGGASRFYTQANHDPEDCSDCEFEARRGLGIFYVGKANGSERPRVDDVAHPTVKPVALMRHLIRLVVPDGGTVLDPFAGSGTTGEAALLEGVKAVLIEREPTYLPLIGQRLDRHLDAESWLRSTGQAEGTLFG